MFQSYLPDIKEHTTQHLLRVIETPEYQITAVLGDPAVLIHRPSDELSFGLLSCAQRMQFSK